MEYDFRVYLQLLDLVLFTIPSGCGGDEILQAGAWGNFCQQAVRLDIDNGCASMN